MKPIRLTRIEIWSDLQCAGGVRLAIERAVLSAQESRELAGIEKLTATLPLDGRGWASAAHERVLRTYLSDGSWEEWRISDLDDQRGEEGALRATIEAVSPLLDLGDTDQVVTRQEANGLVLHDFPLYGLTPAEHLAYLLEAAPSHWSVGTVEPTDAVDLTYAWDSPLSALRQLAEVAKADVEVERDGTAGYRIHLRSLDRALTPGARIRYARNQKGLIRKRDADPMFTRAYPRGADVDGAHADMAEAAWAVQEAAGATITLEDGVVAFAGQLDGLYAEDAATGHRTEITGSGVDQTLVLVDPGTIAAGSLVYIRRDAAGTALTYLDNPIAAATYLRPGRSKHRVIDLPDIPGVNNLAPNPFLESWASGLPTGWSAVGVATVAEETSQLYRRYGAASAQVTVAGDAVGLESDWIQITPSSARPYFTAQIALWVAGGAVRLEMVVQDAGAVETVFPSGATASTNVVGAWTDNLAVAGINLQEVGAVRMKLRVVAHQGAAHFFLDAAQLTQTGSGAETFYAGRSACDLWREANRALADHAEVEEQYDVSLVDLQRIDPDAFAGDAIRLGDLVRIDDIAMGVSSQARIVQLDRNLLVPGDVQITLSNRAPGITGQLTGSARRSRTGSAVQGAEPVDRAVLAQYASDDQGSNASTSFDPAVHTYWRWSLDGGETWTDWAPFVGKDGASSEGRYTDWIFTVSTTQPATPTGSAPAGWFGTPPAYDPATGKKLWVSFAQRDGATGDLLSTWSVPRTLTGAAGPKGDKGDPGVAACSLKLTVAVAEPDHTVTILAFPATATVTATLNGAELALTHVSGGTYTCVLTRSATADQRLIVQAESEGYAAGSSTYSIDRDPTPGLSVSAPVPVFSGSEQSGWQLGGSADDDAKQVEVALTGGLTLAQSTPAVAGGEINSSSAKSFVLTLAQPLGSKGTVTLTPKDGSTRGEPWSMELSLAPRTTATLTEITSTIRRVTLQTDPVGGRIYVRALRASGGAIATYLPSAAGTLDRGTASTAQRSALGPSLTIFVDLAGVGEDLLLEYYSVAGSVTEAIRRQRIDEDHDPEVGVTATGGSNLLAVTATPDDDLVLWRLWAKRAAGAGTAWPTTDGTEGGTPDDRYRMFEGGQDAREVSWWAKEGTWYLLARAYDYAGKYTPTSLVVTVTAAASTAAALSALAVTRQDNASGTDYHVFTWAHNAPITGTSGHVVKVLEGGVIVASKAASTNTVSVATPEQKTAAEANAVFRRYEYTLQLRDSGGAVISSYPLTVEGYYDDGTVAQAAPAETPGAPNIYALTARDAGADWVNTSTAWEIEVDWWRNGVSYVVQTLAPSVTGSSQRYQVGDSAQVRLRYTNEVGPGPWSALSFAITIGQV